MFCTYSSHTHSIYICKQFCVYRQCVPECLADLLVFTNRVIIMLQSLCICARDIESPCLSESRIQSRLIREAYLAMSQRVQVWHLEFLHAQVF